MSELQRLADWRALCAWLEDQPYNAAYEPRCQGAYLLSRPYSPQKTVFVDDYSKPSFVLGGREVWNRKEVPNPRLAEEQEKARWTRLVTNERRRLKFVFWSSGHGWRLHKDYREKLNAEEKRLNDLRTFVEGSAP